MLGMAAEAHVDKVTTLARWLLEAAARSTVRAQCSRAVPAELKTNKRVSREETYMHECARGKTKTIAATKHDSKTNNERSSQLSATGSQQPTANSKQPPGGGGDDGGDGYDDDDDDVILMMTMTMTMTIAMTTSMVMMLNYRDDVKMDYDHPTLNQPRRT